MAKFHIKKDGTPGQCRATKGNCPLGGEGEHYSLAEEAQAAAQEKFEKGDSLVNTSKKIDRKNWSKLSEEQKIAAAKASSDWNIEGQPEEYYVKRFNKDYHEAMMNTEMNSDPEGGDSLGYYKYDSLYSPNAKEMTEEEFKKEEKFTSELEKMHNSFEEKYGEMPATYTNNQWEHDGDRVMVKALMMKGDNVPSSLTERFNEKELKQIESEAKSETKETIKEQVSLPKLDDNKSVNTEVKKASTETTKDIQKNTSETKKPQGFFRRVFGRFLS